MAERSASGPTRPHDGYRLLAAALAEAGLRPADPQRQSLESARAAAEAYYAFLQQGPQAAVQSVEHRIESPVGGYRLRLYRSATGRARLPWLFYAHGGGYVLNSIDSHDGLLRALCAKAGLAVCALGYARAPERRFPAQRQQALHALDWLTERADPLGLDSTNYVLAGDSAGAHLALSTALARGRSAVPRALILAYGMYDPALATPSCRAFAEGFGLTTARMRWFWDQVRPPGTTDDDPLLCPLRAPLQGLPPSLLVVAGLDCLRDDSLALAEAMAAAGVDHRLSIYDDMLHSFLLAPAWLPPARQAIDEMAAFARRHLEA